MTQTVYINLEEEMAAEMESRAASAQLPVDEYIELILQHCMACREEGPTMQEQ